MKYGPETAQAVLDIIRKTPQKWNQEHWGKQEETTGAKNECGTTACVAGWANLLHGNGMWVKDPRSSFETGWLVTEQPKPYSWSNSEALDFAAAANGIPVFAAEALGIRDNASANWLFDFLRTRKEVMVALQCLAWGQQIPEELMSDDDDDDDGF